MRYLKYFFILLFIPFVVNAEECDISNITITSIEQSDINGNTLVVNEPTINGVNIGFDLKMYDVGDSITYDIEIKNDSEEDYMIDEDTFKTDSSYIEYSLKTNDNTNVVKAQSVKGVTLIVEYKKEVEDKLLSNNKYDASNTLKLSLSAEGKEKELNIITTSNIEDVKNPLTNTSSMLLISLVSLTIIIITCILIKRKNKYTKYIIIILSIVLVPTVYAMCQVDIEVDSKIEIERIPRLSSTIARLADAPNSCVTKYEGQVTDRVGITETATKVYFDRCEDQRNVIFGGFCWQVIRTTETGGTKIIYNGEPVDGKCESTRENHAGIVGSNGRAESLSREFLYGLSFTYDTTNNTFTLMDTTTATWSDSTYEDLLGLFTCMNTTGTCTTLYSVGGYKSNYSSYASNYTIKNTKYAYIGVSSFNTHHYSPAMVGYMFNKVYDYKMRNGSNMDGTFKFGSTFTYDDSTNTYTLSGTTQNISDWGTGYDKINNTHYTCWNETGTCNTLSYVQRTFYTPSITQGAYYTDLTNGKSINDALEEMLSADDLNRHNSTIKGIIDSWYQQNLLSKTVMLEDAVYCNARDVVDYGGYNPDGGSVFNYILFKNYYPASDLVCQNITDQFAVSNSKAKLTYPVALLQDEERRNIYNDDSEYNEDYWWELSPGYFYASNSAFVRRATSNGFSSYNDSYFAYGVRPVISLKSNNVISSGTGSESDPWIIK